jgi:hypothetical protein
MAIFGIGAGKILAGVIGGALLGKGAKSKDPFTRGFVRGFAGERGGGLSGILKEDMERTQERIDRIADYKIQRQQKEQERYDKEFREATEKIKGIAGKVGGVDGAEYLVRNYGLTGAEEQATKIQNLMEIYDVSPEFATKDENQTTINDLAKFATAAPTITKVSDIKDDSLFGALGAKRNIGAEVQNRIDLAASQIADGADYNVDLGDMPTMAGTLDLGMQLDPKAEVLRLTNMALKKKDAGDDASYKELMGRATTLQQIIKQVQSPSKLSEAGGRSFTNLVKSHILITADVEGEYMSDGMGGMTFKPKAQKGLDIGAVTTKSAELAAIYGEAIRKGIEPSDALGPMMKAAEQNYLPEVVSTKDGGFAIVPTDKKLFDNGFQGGSGPFAYTPPPSPNQPPPSGQQPSQTGVPTLADLKDQFNAATSQTERDQIERKLRFPPYNFIPQFDSTGTKIVN